MQEVKSNIDGSCNSFSGTICKAVLIRSEHMYKLFKSNAFGYVRKFEQSLVVLRWFY